MVIKPYYLPIICDNMHQLEGFHYATMLYINVGYYTIDLLARSQDMKTTVNEFGKFRSNRPPMVMCASCDTFQAKIDKIIGDIKGVKTFINYILFLRKESFSKHIY